MAVIKCNDNKFRDFSFIDDERIQYCVADAEGNRLGGRYFTCTLDKTPKTVTREQLEEALGLSNAEEDNNTQEDAQTGRKIAYMRISTTKDEQTFSRQEGQLLPLGMDIVYKERVSGSKRNRSQLDKLLQELQPNDVVYITEIARISRSTLDLLSIVQEISNKGASIKSLKDTWLDSTKDNPMATFMLTMVGALAQLEREQIVQRVKEGMEVAKKKGVRFGRPTKNKTKVAHAIELYYAGNHTTKEIAEITGVSKATLYRKLNTIA